MTAPCRVCGYGATEVLLDFGPQPNSLRFLPRPDAPERRHPLVLSVCPACGLVFLADPLPPSAFYGQVQLATSLFPPRHLRALAAEVAGRLSGRSAPLVLEVGCNDGAFLDLLRGVGLSRLQGVEPAAGCAALARGRGLAVTTGFFGRAFAREFLAAHGRPDLVVCRHVLEHVSDLDEFVGALAALIGTSGQLLLELPDLAAIAARGDVSAIWEQHVNYFDLPVLVRLLARFGLAVTAGRTLDYGGGALLVFAASGPVPPLPPAPDRSGLAERLPRRLAAFRGLLTDLRAGGARLAAFGAGMRGAMLLNLADVGALFAYVVDDNPKKIGRFLAGSHLPVRGSEALTTDPPDVLVVLPLQAKETEYAVMKRFSAFAAAGGRFVETLAPTGDMARLVASPEGSS